MGPRPRHCFVCACSVLLLTGCADEGAEPLEDVSPNAPVTGSVELSSEVVRPYVGRWEVVAYNEAGDSMTSYTLIASDDPAGWTTILPGQDPVPVRILEASGDSIVTESGPFPSVIRPGAPPTYIRGSFRLEGERISGRTISRYEGVGADSLTVLVHEGTRAP